MILCVGLSPTVQRTQWFDAIVPGEVNRARQTVTTASGKAVNVARVAATLGADATLLQPLAGASGHSVAAALELPHLTLETLWLTDDAPTRTCSTLLSATGTTTELVEEAAPLPAGDWGRLKSRAEALLASASVLCLSGSLPRGVPDRFYEDLARRAAEQAIPVLVDAQKEPLRLALAAVPWLVKPNRQEAAAALDLPLTDDPAADARRLALALRDRGARNAVVSFGSAGAVAALDDGRLLRLIPPPLVPVNPIGSGDSLAAGILAAVERGVGDWEDRLRDGMAAAAANCLTPTSGVVAPADVARLRPDVILEEWQR